MCSHATPPLNSVINYTLDTNFYILFLLSHPAVTTVFFFLWPSASAKRARIARHLVRSILYDIWVFRNKATFYNVSCDHRAITKFIVSDLRQKVRTDFLRLSNSRFSDLWSLDDFCAEEGGLPELNV